MVFWGKNNPPIKIASAHFHIPRNNPSQIHADPMDSLGDADNRCRKHRWTIQARFMLIRWIV